MPAGPTRLALSPGRVERCPNETRFQPGPLRMSATVRWLVAQGPGAMEIPPIPKCQQEAGVRNRLHFREKPFCVERFAGPFTTPARRMNGRLDAFRAPSCPRDLPGAVL